MDAVRFGRFVHAVRLRMGLRQRDVADRARLSQAVVSRIDRGRLDTLTWSSIERVCVALEIRLDLVARWRGAEGALLLDRDHAAIVELLVRELTALVWETIVEFTFNHYGDRGSVDIVGWHPGARVLLLVEVKTLIVDVQELTSVIDRKARVVPRLIALERGWVPSIVGRLLVVRGSRAARAAVERHGATFASALPDRTIACRRWLRQPAGRLAGILFVAESRLETVMQQHGRVRRVRRSGSACRTHANAHSSARPASNERSSWTKTCITVSPDESATES
jgi:transcriptional regulator with XRE-family HTH domain